VQIELSEEGMIRVSVAATVFVAILLFVPSSHAQSDPQALAFAQQAITALTGGAAVVDATLSGNVTRTVGSNNSSGTANFYAKGQYVSRVDLLLNTGNRSDIFNDTLGPQGEWIDSNGNANPYSPFNCMTDAAWFFPALSSLAFTANIAQTITYIGQETVNGESVQHLQSVWSSGPASTIDFYLDASTMLPVQINFNSHPDNDATTNIPYQITFSNYQAVNGSQIPYHIQEYFNGSLLLDFTVTNAALNTGLSDSLFALQ
jgi:hypothetical protein